MGRSEEENNRMKEDKLQQRQTKCREEKYRKKNKRPIYYGVGVLKHLQVRNLWNECGGIRLVGAYLLPSAKRTAPTQTNIEASLSA